MNNCPICNGKIKQSCKCPMSDSVCENGHKWHYHYKDGKELVVDGHGFHGSGTFGCKCNAKAINREK